MTASQIGPLMAFLLAMAYSPGPGNSFMAALGSRGGVRATLPSTTGYHLATWVVTVLIGAGVGRALFTHPPVAATLGYGGAAYVLWLGVRAWRRSGLQRGPDDIDGIPGFWSGVALLVLNPKAYLIIGLLFTQFRPPSPGEHLRWLLIVTTIFTVNNLVAFGVWAAVGDRLGRWARRRGATMTVDRSFALALIGVGVWLLVSAASVA